MKDISDTIIDLREVQRHLTHPVVARRAALTDIGESFWLITDHDPVELYEFLIELGLTMQTFIFSENEYRVFLGKVI